MESAFSIQVDGWAHGAVIPARFAFGKPGGDEPFAPADNVNPAIRWSGAPAGTKSFAILVHDADVPSSGEDVNQPDRQVPADLPRVDFFHWVLVDIPTEVTGIEEGAVSEGITPRGKPVGPSGPGLAGQNDYTGWFAGDADMEGTYGGYDGPCPPWNDSIVHHYHFTVFALDVESLGLNGAFSGHDVRQAMAGHILAEATHLGTYAMNPAIG